MNVPSNSTPRAPHVAALAVGSLALTVALFADGFAVLALGRTSLVWISCTAIVSSAVAFWLLRPITWPVVMAALTGIIGLLHLLRAL